jgi:adsorption protein B
MAIPRIVVNNAINFAAACRAWRLYIEHRFTACQLTWDKTAHVFPTSEELHPFNRKLGEILLEWHRLDATALELALRQQKTSRLALGQILLERGLVSEDLLADAVASQAKLPRSRLDLAAMPKSKGLASRSLMLRLGLVPLGLGEEGELLLGTAAPPSDEAVATLARILVRPPSYFIITASDFAQGLAFMAMDGSVAQPLAPRTCQLLEDYLMHRILGHPGKPSAPTFPLLEDPDLLKLFLTDHTSMLISFPRRLTSTATLLHADGS